MAYTRCIMMNKIKFNENKLCWKVQIELTRRNQYKKTLITNFQMDFKERASKHLVKNCGVEVNKLLFSNTAPPQYMNNLREKCCSFMT